MVTGDNGVSGYWRSRPRDNKTRYGYGRGFGHGHGFVRGHGYGFGNGYGYGYGFGFGFGFGFRFGTRHPSASRTRTGRTFPAPGAHRHRVPLACGVRAYRCRAHPWSAAVATRTVAARTTAALIAAMRTGALRGVAVHTATARGDLDHVRRGAGTSSVSRMMSACPQWCAISRKTCSSTCRTVQVNRLRYPWIRRKRQDPVEIGLLPHGAVELRGRRVEGVEQPGQCLVPGHAVAVGVQCVLAGRRGRGAVDHREPGPLHLDEMLDQAARVSTR